MFIKSKMADVVNLVEGLEAKRLAYGYRTIMLEFRGEKGSQMHEHQHLNEEIGYLMEGKIEYTIDGETFILNPGDSWCIPENCRHSALALEDSRAIKVFSPVRDELFPSS